MREFRPDLVLASWAYPDGWAAVELGHRAGLPVVIKVHGCDILVAGDGLDRHPGRRRRTVEALRKADGVIAVSRDLADKVAGLGVAPERVRVVYNGVDTGLFHPGPRGEARARLGLDAERPLIVFVGALVKVKAVDVLLAACAKLSTAGERFSCHLVGTGPQRQDLEKQVKRLGLEAVVHFEGSRPHRQLADWYRAANVAVLPSWSEGIPNVLLEAIACGTPFVATKVGGIPEIAHLGTSWLVPPGDPMSLASALAASFVQPASEGRAIHCHASSACEVARFLEETLSHGPGAAVSGDRRGPSYPNQLRLRGLEVDP